MDSYNGKSIIEQWEIESDEGQVFEVIGDVNGLPITEPSKYIELVRKYEKWIAPWLLAWTEESHYRSIENLFKMDSDELCSLAEKAKIYLNPSLND